VETCIPAVIQDFSETVILIHLDNLLESTVVAALNCGIPIAVIADLQRIWAEKSTVKSTISIHQPDRQSLWNSAILHPGPQCVKSGLRLAAGSPETVIQARSLKHSIMAVDVGDLGSDRIIITRRTIKWNDGISLGFPAMNEKHLCSLPCHGIPRSCRHLWKRT
jgi:hypothetical protein